ncbi:UNVERIFIED_CONTAM: hypothetical protein FKN15_019554 [Acipenser sinensis]
MKRPRPVWVFRQYLDQEKLLSCAATFHSSQAAWEEEGLRGTGVSRSRSQHHSTHTLQRSRPQEIHLEKRNARHEDR